jgi:hypothetical protein
VAHPYDRWLQKRAAGNRRRIGTDSLNIALKALQNGDGEEVRQSWLASLMPLRYTVQHLLFRSSSLIRAIGAMTEKG